VYSFAHLNYFHNILVLVITTLIEKNDVRVEKDQFSKELEELLNNSINKITVSEKELEKEYERVVAVDQLIQILAFVQEPITELYIALTRVERKKNAEKKTFNKYLYYKKKGMQKRVEGLVKEQKIFKIIKNEFKNAETDVRVVYKNFVASIDVILDNKILEVKTAKSISSVLNEEYLTELALQKIIFQKNKNKNIDTYMIIYNSSIHVYKIVFDAKKLRELEKYIEKFSLIYDKLKKIYNKTGEVVISKEMISELDLVNTHFIILILENKVYPLLKNRTELYVRLLVGDYDYVVILKKDFYLYPNENNKKGGDV